MNDASNQGGLRTNATAVAIAILVLAVVVEATAGFRLGEAEGSLAEAGVAAALVAATVLVFAQLGRSRGLLAALAACGSVVILWGLNASFSTSLDVAHGGAYGWSGTRVMVLTLFIGPIIGLVAGILTFAFCSPPSIQCGGAKAAVRQVRNGSNAVLGFGAESEL